MSKSASHKHSSVLSTLIKLSGVLALVLVLLAAIFAPMRLSLAKSVPPPEHPTGDVSPDPTGDGETATTVGEPLFLGPLWSDAGAAKPDARGEIVPSGSCNYGASDSNAPVGAVGLTLVISTPLPDTRGGIYVDDTYIWIGDHKNGLWRVEKCTGDNSGQTSSEDAALWDLWHSGDYIYGVGKGNKDGNNLFVYTDTNGFVAGSIATQSGGNKKEAFGIFVTGTYAYVASAAGLEVYDVSDPSSPSYETTVQTGLDFIKVRGAGNYLYATADSDDTLRIFSISADPAAPSLVGTYNPATDCAGGFTGDIRGLYVDGDNDLVYFVNDVADLYIVDVSTPASPSTEGYLFLPEIGAATHPAGGVHVNGENAFLTTADGNNDGHLYWVDVLDPTDPTLVASYYDVERGLNQPYAEDCWIHVAAHDGWTVYKMSGWQPDNHIKNDDDVTYIGDDIYNDDGENQTKQQTVASGETAIFQIKVENDSDRTDQFTLEHISPTVPSDWTVEYFSGTTDITVDVMNGVYSTTEVISETSVAFTLKVTPDSGVSTGECLSPTLRAVSMACPDGACPPGARDTVVARVCAAKATRGSIGNYVWLDEDGDGVQDAGESGIPNAVVKLYDSDGTLAMTTTTDADGGYLFVASAGDYTVTIDTSSLPSGLSANPTYNEDTGTSSPDHKTTVTVADGDEHLTADFGYNWVSPTDSTNPPSGATGAIGDRVWIDADGDGAQDPGEPGLGSVTVRLYTDPDGDGVYSNLAATDVTDAAGDYIFDGLDPGSYVVEVNGGNPPTGYTQKGDPDESGTCSTCDNKTTSPIVVAPGDVFVNADFGYSPPGAQNNSIGDTIYFDADGSDGFGGSDYGIPGVTVALIEDTNGDGDWDAGELVIAADVSDEDGKYLFDGPPDGDYIVWVNDADNVLAELDQSGDPDSTLDNMSAVDLDSGGGDNDGTDALDEDFGYAPSGHSSTGGLIGDFIFLDANGDNAYTTGEPGLEGVTVTLTSSGGSVVTTTSNENGHYSFGDLDADTYTVTVSPPDGTTNSVYPTGGSANQSVVILATGVVTLTHDFGYEKATNSNTIEGTIWEDTDADGFLDGTESGWFEGVTVVLLRDGDIVASTTTDASGNFSFPGLPDDTFEVDVTDDGNVLNGYWHSRGTDDVDNNSQKDSYSVSVTGGQTNSTADFGYYVDAGEIGDFVWEDMDADGIQNDGSTGIQNVTVVLTITYPNNDDVVLYTTTDANGDYSFPNLLLDEDYNGVGGSEPQYKVGADTPTGYNASPIDQGGDDDLDSDDPAGVTATPTQGSTDDDNDFGFWETATISDFVWEDDDADGVQDTGESGIDAVTVNLYDDSDKSLVKSVSTNSSGYYAFTDVITPGDYYVKFETPTDYFFSPKDQDGDDGKDSDADQSNGETISFTVTSGETTSIWDAGMYQQVEVGDWVWVDDDGDGIQDGTENGIAGTEVGLFNVAGVLQKPVATTPSSGAYSFDELTPGAYYLVFTPTTDHTLTSQDANGNLSDTVDSDANPTTFETAVFTLTSGVVTYTWDAGLLADRASIGGLVWYDANKDGIQTDGESGIDNVPVELFNDTTGESQGTDTTSGGGIYSFGNLAPGDYYLVFTPTTGYTFTRQDVDDGNPNPDERDSDPDPTTSKTIVTTLVAGESDTTWDAGLVSALDFCDAPNTYSTTLASDGARHTVVNNLYLGAGADTDGDGQPHTNALGDDNDGDDDEDGVEFAVLVPGSTAKVTVTVGPTSGFLNAWVDFNNDGDWDDAGEWVITDTAVTGATANSLTFDVPSGAKIEALYSRFRFTSDNPNKALSYYDSWDNGEVEGYRLAAIGDLVWEDDNGDGIQDGGESGISGVTVKLYDSDDNLIGSDITDGSGNYGFIVTPDDYYLEFTPPSGYTFTLQDEGSDDSKDSDADPATGQTISTTLDIGDSDHTWSAGMYRPINIGDLVWDDLNADGEQDGVEPSLNGVEVGLYTAAGALVEDTTTSSGVYGFSDLSPGDYYLIFTRTTGYDKFSPQDKAGVDDDNDSDANPATGQTAEFTLTSGDGSNATKWDAGMYQTVSIGDRVWKDLNADGEQDAGEPGLDGVKVKLYDANDALTATATTGNGCSPTGCYTFTGWTPGEYHLVFELPTDYEFSPKDQAGVDDNDDSDADPSNGQTGDIILESGDSPDKWDAGMFKRATVSDRVWVDTNGNGIQDDGEPDVGDDDVEVGLYATVGNALQDTTMTSGGSYEFSNLKPGDSYYLVFTPTGGYELSLLDKGGDDAKDSDADPDNDGKTANFTLDSGVITDTWDAGVFQRASVGDLVWEDLDGNGEQDGEPGVDGVEVGLYNADGLQGTDTTSGGGVYGFSGLAPGTYYLVFTPTAGYEFSPLDRGDDTTDSDIDPVTARTADFVLDSGENDPKRDAGLVGQSGAIGNYVWLDEDGDGAQDAGESGIPNAIVELYDASDALVMTTTTDSDGGYIFTHVLPPAVYTVTVNAASLGDLADNPTYDEDNDTTNPNGETAVTVVDGGEHLTADFGYNWAPPGTPPPGTTGAIGDRVWIDADGDGAQDPGEPGLGNVTVELYTDPDGDGVYNNLAATDVTDAAGDYIFDSLDPGSYVVKVNSGSLPANYIQTGDPDGTMDNKATNPIVVAPGDVFVNIDFGYDPPDPQDNSIGDTVYFDANGDGSEGAGEYGIPGVTVVLITDTNKNGNWDTGELVIATMVTTDTGGYLFTGLPDGNYIVWVNDTDNVLGELAQSGDPDSTLDNMSAVALGNTGPTGDDNLSQDFGYAPPSHKGRGIIGDFVFLDVNGDGFQDTAGEPGLEGVTVTLTASDGFVITTTTDENGHYYFGNLGSGGYTITVASPPAGLDNSVDPDGGNDNYAFLAIENTKWVNLDQDFGYRDTTPNTISGTIWEDTDADGALDGDEPNHFEGVTVMLLRDGNMMAVTTTNASGYYTFTGLPDGDYVVDVTDNDKVLNGYWHSLGTDSETEPYTITNVIGGGSYNADFGYYVEAGEIGNFVWEDTDGDGIQDGGETGIPNVTVVVTITYPNTDVITVTTATDANGYYSFPNLLLDEDYSGGEPTYTIGVDTPSGYSASPIGVGSNDELDSNDPSGTTVVPTQGSTDNDNDFGFYKLATIGDFVWEDMNADGIRDAGETGISVDATVRLRKASDNSEVDSTTTVNGYYTFTVAPGDYYVEFATPTDYFFSPQDQGSDDAADSNANPSNGRTSSFNVTSGAITKTWDAGMYQKAQVGNWVWDDSDGDGIQGDTESGINGADVELFNAAGVSQAISKTINGGYYTFTGVIPGMYYLVFTPTADHTFSPVDQGADDAKDSDANPATDGRTADFLLTSGMISKTLDAGLGEKSTIAGYVWYDADGDGTQDEGLSVGVGGTQVELFKSGVSQDKWTTLDNGLYSFTNLDPGDYYLVFTPTTGYTFTLQDQGTDVEDSDPNQDTGRTTDIELLLGVNDSSWDAGLVGTMDFGDAPEDATRVYSTTLAHDGARHIVVTGVRLGASVDTEGDGAPDANALGDDNDLNGDDEDGVVFATALSPGETATVTVQTTGGWLNAWIDFNDDGDWDASERIFTDRSRSVGTTSLTFTVPSGVEIEALYSRFRFTSNNPNGNLSYGGSWPNGEVEGYRLAAIGDIVWEDDNADGIRNVGESGISDVTVELYDGGKLMGRDVTDGNGHYGFIVTPDDYHLEFTLPSGYTFTVQDANSNLSNTVDSDVYTSTGRTDATTLDIGESDHTWSAGMYQPVSISGLVWEDMDGDSRQNDGLTGIPDVIVNLYDGQDNFVISDTTDIDGNYAFDDLTPGKYYVEFEQPTDYYYSPKGNDSDADPNDGKTTPITLDSGESADRDAGMYQLVSIGDWAWADNDADGIQDDGPTGLDGVRVDLYNAAGEFQAMAMTAGGGYYTFTKQMPGEYYLVFTLAGRVFTLKDAGFDDTEDSDANPANGQTDVFTITSGASSYIWDAGLLNRASLGGRVWDDVDENGIQDGGELGVPGVSVELFDDGGAFQGSATTNPDGFYFFTNLDPGDYYVKFVPSGYVFTLQDVDDGHGAPDVRDSDADPRTGETNTIHLNAGENGKLDAGVYRVPVGGVTMPVSALDLLTPWLQLAALVFLFLAGSAFVVARKRVRRAVTVRVK